MSKRIAPFNTGDRVVFDGDTEPVTVTECRPGRRYTRVVTDDGVDISYRTEWLTLYVKDE